MIIGCNFSMGARAVLFFLFVLVACWACDSRELGATDVFTRVTEISDVSGSQINLQDSKVQVQVLEVVGRNENVCTLCEEFSAEALNYLALNKTQTEIVDILYKSCSKLLSFKQECVALVDYYAPLFFLEISTIQPGDFCRTVNLCQKVVSISQRLSKDSCEFCHNAVAEALIKLKDPDTQLEIIEFLLKGCDAVENYVKKCKTLVFEYAPMILINAEQFLETNDICTMLHACTDGSKQASFTAETSMLAKS